MPERDVKWRISPDAALLFRYWGDGECVLYHGASGDTHRIPDIAGKLLEYLVQRPASTPEASEAIDLHEDDVAMTLDEMRKLGVTEVIA